MFFFHAGLASQPAVPADLLQRAAAYATQFRHEFSGIVAEETYVQDIGRSAGSSVDVVSGRGFALVSHRELKSDLLLVRPGGTERPVDFRDVFAVTIPSAGQKEAEVTAFLRVFEPSCCI